MRRSLVWVLAMGLTLLGTVGRADEYHLVPQSIIELKGDAAFAAAALAAPFIVGGAAVTIQRERARQLAERRRSVLGPHSQLSLIPPLKSPFIPRTDHFNLTRETSAHRINEIGTTVGLAATAAMGVGAVLYNLLKH